MKDSKNPSIFPQEVPFDVQKELSHGAIVDVVQSEISAPAAVNPAKPQDTLNLNTEAAKAYQQNNLNN